MPALREILPIYYNIARECCQIADGMFRAAGT